ncbi:MAG: hypothetical protein JNJ48_04295 [Phycisphaerae bacterium]|nr:hypothetical protein [Phycisphaerae bacterium]
MGPGNESGTGSTGGVGDSGTGSERSGGAPAGPDFGVQREDLVRLYLSTRHVPCPGCGYDLHGVVGPRCPECELPLRVELRGESMPRHLWLPVAALVGVVVMSGHWLLLANLWRFFDHNGGMALGFDAWTVDLLTVVASFPIAGFGMFVGWRAMLARPGVSPYAGYFWCAVVLSLNCATYLVQMIIREVQ